MKSFRDLSTKAKLMLAFSLMIGLQAAVTAVTVNGLTTQHEHQRAIVDQHFRTAKSAANLAANQSAIRAEALEQILAPTAITRPSSLSRVAALAAENDALLAELGRALNSDSVGEAVLAAVREDLMVYRTVRTQAVTLASEGRAEEAQALATGEQAVRFDRISSALTRLQELAVSRTHDAALTADRESHSALTLVIVLGLASLVLGGLMALGLSGLIATPLRALSEAAQRVAKGDLTWTAEGSGKRQDEVGTLEAAFALMVASVRELQTELREGITVLATSSNEMLTTVTQVAAGASETAVAVSETGTTAEEVRQTAQVSNQKALDVQERSRAVATVAEAGRRAVDQMVAGMASIREQMDSIGATIVRLSDQTQMIGEITAAVGDLAEQSNLLAVNAAIEATRAGEYGRGFAVVAQEVKSLAEQSRQATTQVRTLLMDVQRATSSAVMATEQGSKAVAAGVQQAGAAGNAIAALAAGTTEAIGAATQIAASSQQQLVGMDQIAAALGNIRQASAQNVAGTRQLEVAARGLQELGTRVKGLLGRWQV